MVLVSGLLGWRRAWGGAAVASYAVEWVSCGCSGATVGCVCRRGCPNAAGFGLGQSLGGCASGAGGRLRPVVVAGRARRSDAGGLAKLKNCPLLLNTAKKTLLHPIDEADKHVRPRVPDAATALRESPALALLRALAFFCRRGRCAKYLHCYATQEKNTSRRPKSPCGAASALYECAKDPSTPRAAVSRPARAPKNVRAAQVKP